VAAVTKKAGSASPKTTPSEETSKNGKPTESAAIRVDHPKAYTMIRKATTGWRATIGPSEEELGACWFWVAVDMTCLLSR
jgi:hypothetical protein